MMDFSGYEAFLFVLFLPIILAIKSVRNAILSSHSFLRLFSLIGLTAFWVEAATTKLMIVNCALGYDLTLNMALWWHSRARMERHICGLIFSLIIYVCISMARLSVNPVWTHAALNLMFMLIGFLSALILSQENLLSTSNKETKSSKSKEEEGSFSAIKAGCGFGALLSLTNLLLTNSFGIEYDSSILSDFAIFYFYEASKINKNKKKKGKRV